MQMRNRTRSALRPGVPITILGLRFRAVSCLEIGLPPRSVKTGTSIPAASISNLAFFSICTASSCVGRMMSAKGPSAAPLSLIESSIGAR